MREGEIAEDTQTYREMMQMTYPDFLALLGVIEPYIAPRQIVGGNKVITAAERLTLTIRYLATGESYRSLSFQFHISVSGISYIISDVCKAIVDHLGSMYLKVPSCQKEWLEIALKFEKNGTFQTALGQEMANILLCNLQQMLAPTTTTTRIPTP